MQERVQLSDAQINRELLSGVLHTPMWFWGLVLLLGAVVGVGVLAAGVLIYFGVGVLGLNRPVFWGFLITNFVFWVGISHAGVMISAILRLTQAEWRRPVTRAAEVLTIFALSTAALFPLIHTGRPWRALYWVFPYDFSRGIWPNVRSPLIWDPSAIFTYLTGTILFVFIALVPDLGMIRDRTAGWRHKLYSVLSLGWEGNPRQWRLQAVAGILLSALILPVFVSVHSIVSWDFGMAIAVETWHATVFAPYFVIGAVHSGVSAVVTIMALLLWIFKLKNYIRPDHFDALGRLLVVVATAWLYFYVLDFFFGMYSLEPQELENRTLIMFQWPMSFLFVLFALASYLIPIPLWLSKKNRRNIPLMFWSSILVNIGMWLERFQIIVPGLLRKQAFTFTWANYSPTIVEIALVTASFALVGFGLLMFSKFFPLIPVWEQKEGQLLKDDVQVGRARVPGLVHD
ncbi:MAG: NrfD/PsrC family molybdoenzyme membrane anchor subunit [Dehalococcoidia bacterium]|nr:NrfD/PsrC family molybdoenzyme membrane anchor subunit [Dehalococcoidia bacterium]